MLLRESLESWEIRTGGAAFSSDGAILTLFIGPSGGCVDPALSAGLGVTCTTEVEAL